MKEISIPVLMILSIICIPTLFTQGYNYGEALQKAIYFYDAQQSGLLPSDNAIIWRGDSCLSDGADVGEDLSGGWLDAGDHVKFGLPMASTAATLGWAVYEFRSAFESSGLLSKMMSTIKWATDYFIKAHTAENEFYYQVGDGGADHAWWGPVEAAEIIMTRTSYKVTLASPGSAVTGATATALAIASIIFETEDPNYAYLCLQHAEQLYKFALTTQSDSGYTEANGFYTSYSGYWDELSAAAVWLYLKTQNTDYLVEAENSALSWEKEGREGVWVYKWTHSWDDMHYMAQIILGKVTGKQEYIDSVERNLDFWLPEGGITYSPGGLAWLDKWGSLRYAANASLLSFIWANTQVCNPEKKSLYESFAKNQINYILGSNPDKRSYVVGFGNNPPINPHHRTAHGAWFNDIDYPPDNRHILFGALVGGPSSNDGYSDDRTDYQQNEVACDYNAGFIGALARMYILYGGSILTDFPDNYFKPETERYPEYFVRANPNSTSSNMYQIVTQTSNRSAWPATVKNNLSIRFFFDITETINSGYDINDITINTGTHEGGLLSGPFLWSGNTYYIEIDYSGYPIYPGGRIVCERLFVFEISGPNEAAFNPGNDWSYQGLADSPFTYEPVDLTGYTDFIPVYDNGILLSGIEPPLTPTTEPTPYPTPDPIATGEFDIENLATSDYITTEGSIVSGGFIDTHYIDGIFEELIESESVGKPSDRTTQLNHIWTFNIANGSGYVFYLNAHHSLNVEGDNFAVSYSKNNSFYTLMTTVTKTTQDELYQVYVFPEDVSGALYIQIKDTDRTRGNSALDRVFIDHMYVISLARVDTPAPTLEPTPEITPSPIETPAPTILTPPPIIVGDTTGDGIINILDALVVARCYVNLIPCPTLEISDTDCDGNITILDALLIARYYVDLINHLGC